MSRLSSHQEVYYLLNQSMRFQSPGADKTYIIYETGERWDFENIWVEDIYMFHHNGYPYLSWQTFHFEFIPPACLSAITGDETVRL